MTANEIAQLERVASTDGLGAHEFVSAVQLLARLALTQVKTPPYFHLGVEADGFITVHPNLKKFQDFK